MTDSSYHDLHITTDKIERTSIFDLPFNLMVTCTRTAGWELWRYPEVGPEKLVAGEYNNDAEGKGGLRLDVGGVVIVDSLGAVPA
jgi:hypothetical protein